LLWQESRGDDVAISRFYEIASPSTRNDNTNKISGEGGLLTRRIRVPVAMNKEQRV